LKHYPGQNDFLKKVQLKNTMRTISHNPDRSTVSASPTGKLHPFYSC